MDFIIITDSCCDLPIEYIQHNSEYIDFLGMPVNIDGEDYIDDLGQQLSHEFFYEKLKSGSKISTSQINIHRFTEKFDEYYSKGKSIIYIGLSSGLSGSYNNAVLASKELTEGKSDIDITVIDSLSGSVGLGVLVIRAVDMAKQGKSKEEIIQFLQTEASNINHWFAVDDLHFLKRGGRISATTAVVGTALSIKPILTVDELGKIKSFANVRGRKKSISYLYERYIEQIDNNQKQVVVIGHGKCEEEALILKEQVLKSGFSGEIVVTELSATIACHVGPNMLAIAFIGKSRMPKKQ